MNFEMLNWGHCEVGRVPSHLAAKLEYDEHVEVGIMKRKEPPLICGRDWRSGRSGRAGAILVDRSCHGRSR